MQGKQRKDKAEGLESVDAKWRQHRRNDHGEEKIMADHVVIGGIVVDTDRYPEAVEIRRTGGENCEKALPRWASWGVCNENNSEKSARRTTNCETELLNRRVRSRLDR